MSLKSSLTLMASDALFGFGVCVVRFAACDVVASFTLVLGLLVCFGRSRRCRGLHSCATVFSQHGMSRATSVVSRCPYCYQSLPENAILTHIMHLCPKHSIPCLQCGRAFTRENLHAHILRCAPNSERLEPANSTAPSLSGTTPAAEEVLDTIDQCEAARKHRVVGIPCCQTT